MSRSLNISRAYHAAGILGVIVTMLFCGCRSHEQLVKKTIKRYTNNDSTALYSTSANRPFKYGFAYKKEECQELYGQVVKDYQIHSGDVVADIGAASGWKEGIFSVMLDNVTFYVEDIDTNLLNKDQLNKVVAYYSGLRDTPQTNTFHLVIGTKKSTLLPDSLFDKVIVENTLHELDNPYRMLDDISRKLKPGGQLIINENFSNQYKRCYVRGCGQLAFKLSDALDMMELSGFYLSHMTEPPTSFQNILILERDPEKAEAYKERIRDLEPVVKQMDQLYNKDLAEDPALTPRILQLVKDNAPALMATFGSVKDYFTELGYYWMNEGDYKAAINPVSITCELYPEEADPFYDLGYCYAEEQQYYRALVNYAVYWQKKPNDPEIRKSIREVLDEIRVKQ